MEAINEHKDEPFLAVERAVRQAVKKSVLCTRLNSLAMTEGLMNKVSKDLDVMIIGAAIVDLPLRPVSKEVFDVVSYPVDGIAMTIGGDALNESTIITRLGHKVALMSCIGVDVAGAFVLSHCERTGIDTKYIKQDPAIDTSINVGLVAADGEKLLSRTVREVFGNLSTKIWICQL